MSMSAASELRDRLQTFDEQIHVLGRISIGMIFVFIIDSFQVNNRSIMMNNFDQLLYHVMIVNIIWIYEKMIVESFCVSQWLVLILLVHKLQYLHKEYKKYERH